MHRERRKTPSSPTRSICSVRRRLTLSQIIIHADGDFAKWLRDRANARRVPHRLEACGYVAVRNDGAKDGLWKALGKRQVIYAKAELALRDRIGAARRVVGII